MKWISQSRLEVFLLIIIIITAAFFRFYRLDEYMIFLGDEGRDALIVKKILVEYDFPLLGPPTSIGNMYNGPLYYYLMAVAMGLFWLNPVAASGMVALFGTLTVGLIYYLTRRWFGSLGAISAALLYAISPITINYSKFSWNPNPAPFFALLIILGFYEAKKSNNYWWYLLCGASLAFTLQMHYLALILIPVFVIIWFNQFLSFKNKYIPKSFWLGSTLGGLIFGILMSPLLIFDLKYNFTNFKAFQKFFLDQKSNSIEFNIFNLNNPWEILNFNLVERYFSVENVYLKLIIIVIILSPLVFYFFKKKLLNRISGWGIFVLGTYLIIGLLGLSLYKNEIYDHYTTFLNPVIFILFGGFSYLIFQIKNNNLQFFLKIFYLMILGFLIYVNIGKNPLKNEPNKQLLRTQSITQYVLNQVAGKPFNFALISKNNYDAAYKYYLEEYGNKPGILPHQKTDQLWVVCEDEVCDPVGHPKYEIAAFGWTKIEKETEVDGLRIYKLIPNPNQPPAN